MRQKKLAGGVPQKRAAERAGVSLSHPESEFLALLGDRRHDPEELLRLGAECGLDEGQVRYLEEWVTYLGVHWLSANGAGYDAVEGARVFRNPVVSRIIEVASELGLCVGTVPGKEEVCMFLGQQMRSGSVDSGLRIKAAESLAKMRGYYVEGGKGSGGVSIQIVNPYPGETKVVLGKSLASGDEI